MALQWHPDAIRAPYDDAGPFTKAQPKIVWHTTEGTGLPTYSPPSAPHFTLNPQTGKLWQHIALNRSAKSLEHPSGTVETNHAHCIQVELIGFAAQTQDWPQADYARIAKLARWIEANAGIPSKCSVRFTKTPSRLSPTDWLNYAGHLGHQHVPAQPKNHWDPGAFRIDLVLLLPAISAEARKKTAWRKSKVETDHKIKKVQDQLKKLKARAAKLAKLIAR